MGTTAIPFLQVLSEGMGVISSIHPVLDPWAGEGSGWPTGPWSGLVLFHPVARVCCGGQSGPAPCISGPSGQPGSIAEGHLGQPSPASRQLPADGFLARKIGRHRSVVDGYKDVAHTKYVFSLNTWGAEADDLFFPSFPSLCMRCHFCASSPDSATGKRGVDALLSWISSCSLCVLRVFYI